MAGNEKQEVLQKTGKVLFVQGKCIACNMKIFRIDVIENRMPKSDYDILMALLKSGDYISERTYNSLKAAKTTDKTGPTLKAIQQCAALMRVPIRQLFTKEYLADLPEAIKREKYRRN